MKDASDDWAPERDRSSLRGPRWPTIHGPSSTHISDYGDVCQAVTELAEERDVNLSIAEFHTLNRCLDNAIAGAVASWSDERDRARAAASGDSDKSPAAFTGGLGKLIDKARMSLDVILQGRVAVGGATGMLLQRTLAEMRPLIDEAAAP